MFPHERSLVKRLENKPFALIGINSDKDKNLIGCQNFLVSVEAGKENQAGTFIQLPRDQIARIAFYSVAFYESDQPIGEK